MARQSKANGKIITFLPPQITRKLHNTCLVIAQDMAKSDREFFSDNKKSILRAAIEGNMDLGNA